MRPRAWLLILAGAVLLAAPLRVLAQEAVELKAPTSALLQWVYFVGGFVGIWIIFYYFVYPYYVRYFSPDFTKGLFWTLFLLWAFGWLFYSSYKIFWWGWYYYWVPYTAIFLAALWVIWIVVVIARRSD